MTEKVDFRRLNQAQVAAAHGVDVRTIRRWVADGCPRYVDGLFDLPRTIEWRLRQIGDDGRDYPE